MATKDDLIYLPGADQPAQRDTLHLGAHIRGLAEFIRNCQPPMTVSLQGSWGSGKSSMINLLTKELEKDAVCVCFNTWQYSQFDLGAQLPLLFYQSLIEKLGAKTPDATDAEKSRRVAEALKKGLLHLGMVTARHFGVDDIAAEVLETAKEVQAAGKERPASNGAPASLTETVEGLRESFQELVTARCAQEGKERAVFFIDDLDRLPPARAVELMEVLKTALECDRCVFVLAIDYEVVLRGVRDKYGEDFGGTKGRSFFDKMIQLPFDLPVEQYRMDDFLEELIRGVGDPKCAAALLGLGAAALTPHLLENAPGAEAERPGVRGYVRDMALLAVGHNPRSLKRLFNAFTLTFRVAQDFGREVGRWHALAGDDWVLLFGVTALKFAYPKLYDHLMAVCHTGLALGEFYNWFHSDAGWARLQNEQAATARRLGLAELDSAEEDRVKALVRRFFQCSLLEEAPELFARPPEVEGELSLKERCMLARDGLPFPVKGWQALENVLESGAANDWVVGKEHSLGSDRFPCLMALLRTVTIRWRSERWIDLSPRRLERCVQELCDNLRQEEQGFRAFFDADDGPQLGYSFEISDYPESSFWEAIYEPGLNVWPRDFRLLVEKIRLGGDGAEEAMDDLAAMLERLYGVSDTHEPFDTPEARRRALTCLEPGM